MKKKGEKIAKIWESCKDAGARIVLSVLFGAAGLADLCYLWYMSTNGNYYAYWQLWNWSHGIVINLLLGAAFMNGIKAYLEKREKSPGEVEEGFYEAWQREGKKQQKAVVGVFLAAMIAALWIHLDIKYTYSGWMIVMTPLVQLILAEACLIRWRERCLRRMMEQYTTGLENMWKEKAAEAARAAVRSERMKVDLISNVSHDLKTPLTSMVGYIELIKKEELSEVVADYVEVLGNKAQKLKEMIDSLFDLAKTSSGNIKLDMEQMELNRLVEQVQADMEDKFREAGREIVRELTEERTDFISDSSYMYRICQNLMENALKYSAAQTRIFFKTARIQQSGREMVQLEVTNTASYRMNFTKEQIVERFVRGDEARTSEGNGLGLAIVSTYTSALGGRFDVNIDCDQFKAVVEFPAQSSIQTAAEKNTLQSAVSMV